jgi:spore maturation protein CgeB
MQHSYGDPKREYSYEYFNFYLTLQQMGHEVELFDYAAEIRVLGKNEMNKKLYFRVKEWQPTVTIFSLYTDQFLPETISAMRSHTKTFCFFHDDTWRVDYSRYWAKHFDYFSTPDYQGEIKYCEIGLPNAFYFPFGCNQNIFKKLGVPKKYDISFVGGWHPYREWLIERIKKANIKVEVAGHGWPNGEIDQEGMVRIFNESRINLNLSNSASWDARYLAYSARALINRLRSKKNIEQLKARIFEVSGCGSFQLSYYVEGLASCYSIDTEIGVYADPNDLLEKIKFYLIHEEKREEMAELAYRRTQREHTFTRRFHSVFEKMGLTNEQ